MVLMHVAIPKSKEDYYARAPLDDTYFGPIYPEAPPFKDPKTDLMKIGITYVRVVTEPEWKETESRRPKKRQR